MEKKISAFSVVGMVVGVALSIYGAMSLVFVDKLAKTSFGGDFYTYTYEAIVKLYENVNTTIGMSIFLVGVLVVCHFGNNLYKYTPTKTREYE